MGQELETLFKLQALDLRLIEKENQIEKYEQALAERRLAMDACQARIDEATTRRKTLVNDRAFAERRVSDNEEQLKERRSRMARIRTERELKATEGEITSMRDEISSAEQELLDLDAKVREIEAHIAEIRKEHKDIQEADHRAIAEEAERIEALKAELASHAAERESMATALEPGLSKRYELVIRRRGGIAVVEVRAGSCGGCHMHVPPQMVIEIMKSGTIHNCPNCQRILYVAEVE